MVWVCEIMELIMIVNCICELMEVILIDCVGMFVLVIISVGCILVGSGEELEWVFVWVDVVLYDVKCVGCNWVVSV